MKKSFSRRSVLSLMAAFVLAGWTGTVAGCGSAHDHGSHDHGTPGATSPAPVADPSAKPYPLKTCVVSGEELGSMGEPMRFNYKGQEIKLCCKGCEKDFRKDPERFLQKIAAASPK